MRQHRNPDVPPLGRLAPSPTGRLHVGNLSTALLAALDIRARAGTLLLRIEDLDPPRVRSGAEEAILHDLRRIGVEWDHGPGTARYWRQSERTHIYEEAFERLRIAERTYPCSCSRRDVEEALSAPHAPLPDSLRYPGTCAGRTAADHDTRAGAPPSAWRFRAQGTFSFVDRLAGPISADLARDPGDFVIRRKDGLFAYQLAVVVDDIESGVTDVLRGRDLLDSTPRQLALWTQLGASPPSYAHAPLLLDMQGERLSKRRADISLDGLCDAGWTAGLLRGAFALLWGWRDRLASASFHDLQREADWDQLRRDHIPVPDAFFEGPKAFDAWTRNRRNSAP